MSNVRSIEEALAAGRFSEAETLCRDALNQDPDSLAVLRNLAVAVENLGRLDEAASTMVRAFHLSQDDPDTLYEYARVMLHMEAAEIEAGEVREPYRFKFPWGEVPFPNRLGFPKSRRPQALDCLRRCLALQPAHQEARLLLGLALMDEPETLPEGAGLIQAVLGQNQQLSGAHFGIGRIAFIQGQFEIAEAAFGGTLNLAPDDLLAQRYLSLVRIIRAGGDAAPLFEELSDADLMHVVATLRMFLMFGAARSPQGAGVAEMARQLSIRLATLAQRIYAETNATMRSCRLIDAAARLTPNLPEASAALGRVFLGSALFYQAQVAFEWAIHAGLDDASNRENAAIARALSDHAEHGTFDLAGINKAHWPAIARAFRGELDFASAEAVFRLIYEQHPDDLKAGIELIQAMSFQAKLEEALELALRLEKKAPNDPDLQSELWILHASLGHPEIAWPYHESRLAMVRASTPRQKPPIPQWNGEELSAADKILIWPEEGIGDEMRFASCVKDAQKKFDNRIVVESSPRLLPLLQRSMPGVRFIPEKPDATDFSDYQYHLPIGSLPLHFRRRIEDFPADGRYISADPARVERWRKRLKALSDGPVIGLGWRSLNPAWSKRLLHGTLIDLMPVLKAMPQAYFINLQLEAFTEEVEAVERDCGVKVNSFADLDLKNDFEEVAALLTALDYVVGARSWILSFAGAVGTKAFCFSNHPNPFMFGLDYEPWSVTTRVFYRRYGESWQKPVEAIAAAIVDDHATRAG